MAPASTTIMTTVPARQAGAGSAINDTIREVGGALGIAIIGSLAAAVYRSQLAHVLIARHAPALAVHAATSSVAAADQPAGNIGTKSHGQRLSFRGSSSGTAEYRERARAGTSRGEDDRTAPRGGAEGRPDWADLYSMRG